MRLFKHRLSIKEDGYTLVELIISLAMIALIVVLCLNVAAFSALASKNMKTEINQDLTRRRIVTHFQKQIEMSDTIRIHNGIIYLQDMESNGYYNYYTLNNGTLMRHKTNPDLTSIGLGSTSQFAIDLTRFDFNAEVVNHQPTGKITLTLQFKGEDNDENFSFKYPGKTKNITIQ